MTTDAPRCAKCAGEAAWVCDLCHRSYCTPHLIYVAHMAVCVRCDARRERRVPRAVVERVTSIVNDDVLRTVGEPGDGIAAMSAARVRLNCIGAADFEWKVVDDVQQHIHDTFLDTTWPACPDHPNHPLWYSGGWWRCERTGKAFARLGELPARAG